MVAHRLRRGTVRATANRWAAGAVRRHPARPDGRLSVGRGLSLLMWVYLRSRCQDAAAESVLSPSLAWIWACWRLPRCTGRTSSRSRVGMCALCTRVTSLHRVSPLNRGPKLPERGVSFTRWPAVPIPVLFHHRFVNLVTGPLGKHHLISGSSVHEDETGVRLRSEPNIVSMKLPDPDWYEVEARQMPVIA